MADDSQAIVVERLPEFPNVPLPARATPGSAGFDLYAAEAAELPRGAVVRVRTGLKMRAPPGSFLEIRPRSGLSVQGVLMVNAPGTIDRDYSGEVQVPLTYLFEGRYEIRAGDRIAQIRRVADLPTEFVLGAVVPSPGRSGGFGSTGR